MRVLLHTCCGPCLIYPHERLNNSGFHITAFFYNPNIHGFREYINRRQALEEYGKSKDIEILYPGYNPKEFFNYVNEKEFSKERCLLCWRLRLEETARIATEKKFDYFSTTLLVSPYQDQGSIKKIGVDISKKKGVDFYYEDFRPGFRQAHNKAKAQGMYCQKYCGCIYSEIERYESKGKEDGADR